MESAAFTRRVPRVCFVAESQVGIGSVAKTLKPLALSAQNPTVEWVDVTYSQEGGLLERLPLPPRVAGTARGFLQTRAGLGRGTFEALLFLTQNPAVLQPAALRRTPALLWTDVTPIQLDVLAEHYNHPREGNALAEKLKHAAVRHAFRAARWCVGWSEWVRRSFIDDYGVSEQRTAVIPPGLDLKLWQPPVRIPKAPGAPLRLLFVGGDFRRKGGTQLIDVFRETLRGSCELDLVTREPVEPEPGVRVHHGLNAGTEGLLELYRKADLFVLPTLADCQPIALLEAMAMSLPVVSTRLAANPEVVADGSSGWLVPPGDARALSERLGALARDPAPLRAYGEAGLSIVRERFDAAKIFDQLLRLSLDTGRGESTENR
ncbi:MAG: glycosyltransferase family 4 protein [Myxococcales bacterium]